MPLVRRTCTTRSSSHRNLWALQISSRCGCLGVHIEAERFWSGPMGDLHESNHDGTRS